MSDGECLCITSLQFMLIQPWESTRPVTCTATIDYVTEPLCGATVPSCVVTHKT